MQAAAAIPIVTFRRIDNDVHLVHDRAADLAVTDGVVEGIGTGGAGRSDVGDHPVTKRDGATEGGLLMRIERDGQVINRMRFRGVASSAIEAEATSRWRIARQGNTAEDIGAIDHDRKQAVIHF